MIPAGATWAVSLRRVNRTTAVAFAEAMRTRTESLFRARQMFENGVDPSSSKHRSLQRLASDLQLGPSRCYLNFLRPVDYYRGNPETLLAERRRKLSTAGHLRTQENIRLRQRPWPRPEVKFVSYPEREPVSL